MPSEGPHLEQLLGKADGDDPGGAAHAAQIVRLDVAPHLKMIHNLSCTKWAGCMGENNQLDEEQVAAGQAGNAARRQLSSGIK